MKKLAYKKESVNGHEEYAVDTNGVVYGKNGRPLKYSVNHNGYCIINFYENGKRTGAAVHTIVASQFLEKGSQELVVNHIDGNKKNNSIENLEWVTASENMKHSVSVLGQRKGTNNSFAKKTIAYDKRGNVMLEFDTLKNAAEYISVSKDCSLNTALVGISRAISGDRKSYKGFMWSHK